MPDVVIVEEVKEDAVTVVLSGLCGGFLAEGQGQQPTNSALARPGPDPLPPTPWHPLVPDRKHSALTHAFLSPSMASRAFLKYTSSTLGFTHHSCQTWHYHSFHSESQVGPEPQLTACRAWLRSSDLRWFCPKYYTRPCSVPGQQRPWPTLQTLPALPTPVCHTHFLTLCLEQPRPSSEISVFLHIKVALVIPTCVTAQVTVPELHSAIHETMAKNKARLLQEALPGLLTQKPPPPLSCTLHYLDLLCLSFFLGGVA